MIDAPDLELVGVRVYDPAKVGHGRRRPRRSAGDRRHRHRPRSRRSSTSIPDVVLYMGRVENDPDGCFADVIDLLRAGIDVITTGSSFIDTSAFDPGPARSDRRAPANGRRAPSSASASSPASGARSIAPVLVPSRRTPATASRSGRRLSYAGYPSTQLLFDIMGYGQPADSDRAADERPGPGRQRLQRHRHRPGQGARPRGGSPRRRSARSPSPTASCVVAAGTIPAGTVGAMKLGVRADCGPVDHRGRARHLDGARRRTRVVGRRRGLRDRVRRRAVAALQPRARASTARTTPTMGCLATAMHAVHAIPVRASRRPRRARPRRRDHLRRETDMSTVSPARIGLLIDYLDRGGQLRREHPAVAPARRRRVRRAGPARAPGRVRRPRRAGPARTAPSGPCATPSSSSSTRTCSVIFGPWVSENGVALRALRRGRGRGRVHHDGRHRDHARRVGVRSARPARWRRSRSSWPRSPRSTAAGRSASPSRTPSSATSTCAPPESRARTPGCASPRRCRSRRSRRRSRRRWRCSPPTGRTRSCTSGFGLGIPGMNDALAAIGWMPPRYTTTAFEFAATSDWWRQQLAGWIGLDQYDERNEVGPGFLDRFEARHGHRPEYFFPLYCYDVGRMMLIAIADGPAAHRTRVSRTRSSRSRCFRPPPARRARVCGSVATSATAGWAASSSWPDGCCPTAAAASCTAPSKASSNHGLERDRIVTTRVIQWATGAVGSAQLREVIDSPDLELVGLFVYSPAKVGVDAGALVGRPPTGVLATDDKAAILALDADLVLHAASKAFPDNTNTDDIVALLESGKNVITTTSYNHLPTFGPEVNARIVAACRVAGTRFHAAGEHPGFMFERLATTLTALSAAGRPDHRAGVRRLPRRLGQGDARRPHGHGQAARRDHAPTRRCSGPCRSSTSRPSRPRPTSSASASTRSAAPSRPRPRPTTSRSQPPRCRRDRVVGQMLSWTAYRDGEPVLVAEEYWTVTDIPEWDLDPRRRVPRAGHRRGCRRRCASTSGSATTPSTASPVSPEGSSPSP